MTYHADLLARAVPRYTSYPTAAEFTDAVGGKAQADGLAAVGEHEPLSLYLHIPFCEKICFYCGCNTGAANRRARLAAYLDRLGEEIDLVAARLEGRGRVVRVAFGGGSPNAVRPADFDRLSTRLLDALGGDKASWSVEIDPRNFTAEFAAALARAGVRRASLGVQTFDPEIQRAIGREQSFETVARAVHLLRDAGVDSLNFDLMYGLPGQDETLLARSIEQALALAPDRMAIFGYAHVPDLIPRQRRIDGNALARPGERFAMAEAARAIMVGQGWQAVGFDHFALPADPLAEAARMGRLRRNFQGYTDDPCDTLIGMGASSISRFANALVQNEKNNGRWAMRVASGMLPATRGVTLGPLERLRGRAIERFLCDGAVKIAALPDATEIADRLAPFFERGLLERHGGEWRIAEAGWPYARAMAATMDPHRQVSARRFSSAV
ncbi:oxygen-independent coproporphyrinogen III oxidase [Sphingomicrobium nitratireducens]|uniref:oxygen-independent coproporphyrinogen III oxidase n=1 Tax=Sphingomicrobium nitratireducens TaxID=2964666 RepID=UPI00223F0E11|nr:oxygen-independent coproporphyrinogen III oxidase [Sphingomicrobium nitratireducens]